MKLEAKDLPMTTLRAKSPEDIDAMVKSAVQLVKAKKDLTKTVKSASPAMGKLLTVLAERLQKMKDSLLAPASKSLKELFAEITKGGRIQGGWYYTKDAYAALVSTGKITEQTYDSCSANSLETAGQIYCELSKKGGALDHPVIAQVAQILTERVDGYPGLLRSILESVKPVEKLTMEEALENIGRLFEDGFDTTVANELAAHLRTRVTEEKRQKEIFMYLNLCLDACGSSEQQTQWVGELERAGQPMQVITPAA